MAEIYKLIHPLKYFNDYISREVRPDGRKFYEQRNLKLNVNSLKTAEASAVVKCGNTTVVCGIQLELASPKAEEPDIGYLVTNLELPALCSPKYRPGPPSDHAQVTNYLVSDIILNSKCINLKDLCIVPHKLAWVLYCDIICLDNDGSLVDACIIALMASLKTLNLPTVIYDIDTEDIKVNPDIRTPLTVHGLPVAMSFAVYKLPDRNILLSDPSAYEEEICGGIGANFIVCSNQGLLCGTQKFGGSNLLSESQEEALKICRERAEVVEKILETCIKDDNLIN